MLSQKQDHGYERRIAVGPLIDVEGMARAIEWANTRETDQGGNGLFVNVGSNEWSCQVKDPANAVAQAFSVIEVRISL